MKKLTSSFFLACFLFLGVGFVNSAKASVHSVGTNITSSGTVFMITSDGQRRPYTSAGAFLSYGFNTWSTVETATTEDLALPVGAFIPPRDGKILCSDRGTDKGTCYLITNGKRAGFTSEKVFKSLGFDFSKALYGDVSFLDSDTNVSEETENHRAGVLINKNGTVYLVGINGLLGIPNEEVLKSWGYSFNDTVNANINDQKIPEKSVVTPRIMGELRPQSSKVLGTLIDNTNTGTKTENTQKPIELKKPLVQVLKTDFTKPEILGWEFRTYTKSPGYGGLVESKIIEGVKLDTLPNYCKYRAVAVKTDEPAIAYLDVVKLSRVSGYSTDAPDRIKESIKYLYEDKFATAIDKEAKQTFKSSQNKFNEFCYEDLKLDKFFNYAFSLRVQDTAENETIKTVEYYHQNYNWNRSWQLVWDEE